MVLIWSRTTVIRFAVFNYNYWNVIYMTLSAVVNFANFVTHKMLSTSFYVIFCIVINIIFTLNKMILSSVFVSVSIHCSHREKYNSMNCLNLNGYK